MGEVKLGEQQNCLEGSEGSGGHCVSSCQLRVAEQQICSRVSVSSSTGSNSAICAVGWGSKDCCQLLRVL